MSTTVKIRIAALLVIAYFLWGGVHRYLVHRFEINPWKFGGMAMYATPAPKISIAFFEPQEDGSLSPLHITARAKDQPTLLRFFENRRHAGMLLPPDDLATHVFAARPDIEACAIVITRRSLDPASDTIVARRRGYRYERASSP